MPTPAPRPHPMDTDTFERLCQAASRALDLSDPQALGRGHTVTLDGVHLEAQHRDGRPHFLLLAEIALFAPDRRGAVHERLLTLQLASADHPNLRFGFHPLRHTTLACITATPPPGADAPAWLTRLIRASAERAREWRTALLTEPSDPLHPGAHGMPSALARGQAMRA